MTQEDYTKRIHDRKLQETADRLFAACLQFLIAKEETMLVAIRDLSQELLDKGYETTFEHKKKALIIRSMFHRMNELALKQEELDKLNPRSADLEGLPNAS